jgi:hypothetical protein
MVVDNKGTTVAQLKKIKEGQRRERIDPSNPYAPTRKWLNITEARALLPDKGNEEVRFSSTQQTCHCFFFSLLSDIIHTFVSSVYLALLNATIGVCVCRKRH